MSKELLDALESRLLTAVDTIESLRREIDELKDERRLMEEKLRGLIGRIDQASGEPATAGTSDDSRIQRSAGSYDAPPANPYRQPDADF